MNNFDNEPKIQGGQQMKEQQSYISVFVAYLTISSTTTTTSPDMIRNSRNGRMIDLWRYRATSGEKNFIERIKAQIRFTRENQPQHLKRWFFLKNRPIHCHINSTCFIRPVKQNQLAISTSTSHFQPQSTVSHRSDSSLEANSSCCHRSDVWLDLE